MTTALRNARFLLAAMIGLATFTAWTADPSDQAATVETDFLRLHIAPKTGQYEILDKKARITWSSHPQKARFGEATVRIDSQSRPVNLERCEVRHPDQGQGLDIIFHPVDTKPDLLVRVHIRLLPDNRTLEFAYDAAPGSPVESVRLLDNALWVTDTDKGYALVPVREGLLVPADSGLAFTQRFDTYAYEGCHMTMLGLCKGGAAALVTWDDPYVAVDLQSTLDPALDTPAKQLLAPSLVLRQSANSFRIQFLGQGDHVTLAQAYRKVAQQKGWLVTWEEKLKGHPERAKLFGAVNYKLWSVLSRQMNETSTQEERVRVNWTFEEAAQVAEHLKNDLKLDRVLFLMGGWIRRGYDNQHPDILPAAPECGGDDAFANCARRVRQLGYLLGLHDNYQDMYRDAPSWDESFLMKTPDGQLARGGRWAGGRAYLTCSKKAVELAKRPQNLPAVKELTQADAYFIDTTYAAGLQECFDPNHPLTRADDMHWKQVISDYARELYGIFGSECGREWAIPHSDFFEGLTGVSGHYYHNAELVTKLGGTVLPLFELVYRDGIALYGKYGYDPAQAALYVLHHIAIGRPLHYHNIPAHLYWREFQTLPTDPAKSGPDPAIFTRGDNGWADGLHPLDRFVKNTYEILSPLNELTAQMRMTQHQFLAQNRQVQRSVFGQGTAAVEVIVNASADEYRPRAKPDGEMVLPPYGFVISSSNFAAFLALCWNGLRYQEPVLFTLRSLDGQPLERSRQVRIFHGFGDARVRLGETTHTVPREEVVGAVP